MKRIGKILAVILAIIMVISPITAFAEVKTGSPFDNKTYTHQEKLSSMNIVNGIDLSHHNDSADFKALKDSGIDFAILRIGYRGYGYKGNILNDTRFDKFYEDAKAEGLLVGAYFYSQALNEKEAIQEADRVLENLKGRPLDLPVVFDYEFADVSDGRLDEAWRNKKINKEKMTQNAIAFCERIKENGYNAMVYASKYFFYDNLDYKALEEKGYGIWLAHYDTKTDYKGKFDIWQYSSKGKINGVSGNVDCNFMYVDPFENIIDIYKTKGTVIGVSSTAVKLQWDEIEGVDGYDVCRKRNDVYYPLLQTTKTTANITDLTPASNCYFAVVAYRYIEGIKYYGEFSKTIKATTNPAKVTGLKESSKTDTTISFKWNKTGYPTGYNVYLYNGTSKKYELYKTVTKNSVKVTGLKPNKNYVFKVEALKYDTDGPRSDKLTVRTKPKKPVVKSASSPKTKQLKLSWDKNTKNVGYQVQWSTTKDFSSNTKSETFKNSKATSRTIKTYRSKSNYSIRVRSYVVIDGKKVYSPWSNSKRLKVK